ncbi:ABC transporter ATP-binding protein [Marinithermus hydrothermalis]|uniref:Heme exporter protein CcmA n=1 Tax=Marinithermus hydrothermalis (strain DSM 14884 / JCM 11576 / T1) TaxID=869210 RepID=F2NPV9_MARHT|nr:ABC transporter ATP-binding protein [Marinithermus hydrothermalis]AEB12885.1 heme exporter protein CcmA [Marinithermus hydrothermalis DSM 14884]
MRNAVRASEEASLEAIDLTKHYGRRPVLEGVHLALRPGEVYALAGPNGSGKTTLIRLVTGLAYPTRGKVLMLGQNIHEEGYRARRYLGAVVEAPAAFYGYLTGRVNLERLAWLSGLRNPHRRIREVLARLELLSVADRPVGSYSLGQRQRLGLAAAILAEPKVLVLDEPTSGLDPLGIQLVHEILAEQAAAGTAVLLSTHHLREVSGYAHRVGILGGGRLLDEVRLAPDAPRYRLRVSEASRAAAYLETFPGVREVRLRGEWLILEGEVEEAVKVLVRDGYRVHEVTRDYFDLYEYYRERVQHA